MELAEAVGARCVLCLGHNRGWQEAASALTDRTVRLGSAHAALLQVSWWCGSAAAGLVASRMHGMFSSALPQQAVQ